MDYGQHVNPNKTSQTNPIFGKTMEKNEAGGYGFKKDSWSRLNNFLILGSEGGTYYVQERELTVQNADNIIACIKEDGARVVNLIVDISHAGRAPKNDPAIFTLCLAAVYGNEETKKLARENIFRVCRTGTHLFQFCETYKKVGGKTSRALKRGISNYYLNKTPDQLALQLIKYRQRNGWTHRDVLRIAHPTGKSDETKRLLRFAAGKLPEGPVHAVVEAFQRIQSETDEKVAAKIIREARLPWEAVPTDLLKSKIVWDALLPNIGYTALMRNLGKLSSIGMLDSNLSDSAKFIINRLSNEESMKKARVHPFQILLAYSTYGAGKGVKGSLTWKPIGAISQVLDSAFFKSFGNVVPTKKNILVGMDVSGSMTSARINNTHITAATGAMIMSLIHYRTEPHCEIVAFDTNAKLVKIGNMSSLDGFIKEANAFGGGGTDCSIPFRYAIDRKLNVDGFIIYTDSGTWAGDMHPVQAFNVYRKHAYEPAKAIGVEMSSTSTTIVDPENANMRTIVGMDANVPHLVTDFIGTLQ